MNTIKLLDIFLLPKGFPLKHFLLTTIDIVKHIPTVVQWIQWSRIEVLQNKIVVWRPYVQRPW